MANSREQKLIIVGASLATVLGVIVVWILVQFSAKKEYDELRTEIESLKLDLTLQQENR